MTIEQVNSIRAAFRSANNDTIAPRRDLKGDWRSMRKNTFLAAMLAGLVAAPAMAAPRDYNAAPEVNANQKGSLLWWSDVEVKYSGTIPVADTIIELTNDSNAGVFVQLYFVNGDCPTDEIRSAVFPFEILERAHPGCNYVDVQIFLSANKPTYWSAGAGNNVNFFPFPGSGDSLQVPPFGNLDADPFFPGRPDPDNHLLGATLRTVRGYVVGWAVDGTGSEITHNELTGSATKIDYTLGGAWEYDAFAYRRSGSAAGDGVLQMNGTEYQRSPARLQLDFYSVPSLIFTDFTGVALLLDSDLTIHPTEADFRATGDGPVTTWVQADIWNQNEDRFSGAARCIQCWDQVLLGDFMGVGVVTANHFLRDNIGTDKGKARLTGKGGVWCPNCFQDHDESTDDDHVLAVEEPILGVSVKGIGLFSFNHPRSLDFDGVGLAGSNLTMHGTDDTAEIHWDRVDPAVELQDAEFATMSRSRAELGGARK